VRKDWMNGDRICVLIIGQTWSAPEDGKRCANRGHCHMTRAKVNQLVNEGKMEFLRGLRTNSRGVEEEVRVPVARFVTQRQWKKTMSLDETGAVATMQLVP
jgi:hypothetical protein